MIVAFPGFVSLEILSPVRSIQSEWVLIQRFQSAEHVLAWRASKEHKVLIDKLKVFLASEESDAIQEDEIKATELVASAVTEAFITQVNPDKNQAFLQWTAKIYQIEATFPGFQGVYVELSSSGQRTNWITHLKFDTAENLDRWLASPERQLILNELKPLIKAIESHRVISPYAGWFLSLANKGAPPPVWKQTMIVLLVLFPIVMLELKFLSPLTKDLGVSLSMFIGNAISVTLISWPMMSIAVWFLGWWLSNENGMRLKTTIGIFVMMALYLLEIVAFSMLLDSSL